MTLVRVQSTFADSLQALALNTLHRFNLLDPLLNIDNLQRLQILLRSIPLTVLLQLKRQIPMSRRCSTRCGRLGSHPLGECALGRCQLLVQIRFGNLLLILLLLVPLIGRRIGTLGRLGVTLFLCHLSVVQKVVINFGSAV